MNFVAELKWRNMIHDIMPGTEETLTAGLRAAYVGYDPTAPSLHIGNLATIMMLVHFQRCGHKPIALVGGATGMIGDPSGRSEERQLLSEETIRFNQGKIKIQLEKFLDFNCGDNSAEMVNNFDWFKPISFLSFLRDAGKHISINYMLAKESVKQRLDRGISFTEFSYQLLQAYDYYWLYQNKRCVLQMGGSDQWGNITTGTELIRRKASADAFALTCPLITNSDGSKFGKSEGENIWLSAEMTSPYKFYQYWLNCSDQDADVFMKIFTLFSKEEIESMEEQHALAPHKRLMQQKLAENITARVHSEAECRLARETASILFGQGTTETLRNLNQDDLNAVFEGVPRSNLPISELRRGIPILELLADRTGIFPSKGEARRMIKGGGVAINKKKVLDTEQIISSKELINDSFILVQKGKKNYYLIQID